MMALGEKSRESMHLRLTDGQSIWWMNSNCSHTLWHSLCAKTWTALCPTERQRRESICVIRETFGLAHTYRPRRSPLPIWRVINIGKQIKLVTWSKSDWLLRVSLENLFYLHTHTHTFMHTYVSTCICVRRCSDSAWNFINSPHRISLVSWSWSNSGYMGRCSLICACIQTGRILAYLCQERLTLRFDCVRSWSTSFLSISSR